MLMNTELKSQKFESLPNRVKVALKRIDRGPGPSTEVWLSEAIPALGGKSVLDTLASNPDGELEIVAYCNAVESKFF